MPTPPASLADSAKVPHPVMDYGVDRDNPETYVKAAAPVMAMPDDAMLAMVPPLGFVSFCECPACYGGSEGRGVFTWTIDKPDQLRCRYCDTVVLPNPQYDEDQTLTGVNALGETVSLPFYRHPETDAPHFFSMHLWLYKRQWLMNQGQALGRAYLATGDEAYARKAVLLLDRFAQVYPHYPALHNRYSRGVRFCESQEPPFSWDAGRWGYFHNEIPKPIIAIYDMVYESAEFDRLADVRGYDIRQTLEDDFLRETYRIAASSSYHVGNVVGYDVAGVAILGRVLNEPDYVHQALGWMMDNVQQGFFRDGLWHESPSYHYMTVGGLRRAFAVLEGYSDPPGYTHAEDGTRLDEFHIGNDLPFFAKAQRAPEILDFPNGCSTPVHDTWPNQRRSTPRKRTVSTIAPAYGHASLGRGSGSDQIQAQLHFGGTYGHHHLDALNLTLFAKEREMLPDLGYTWTQVRSWTVATLAHNTVTVDRQNQRSGRDGDGRLLNYVPNADGISLVEADAPRIYDGLENPGGYHRVLILVPVSPTDAYVIDVFQVRGGSIHDWALHGDADEDTRMESNLTWHERRDTLLETDETWTEPATVRDRVNPYGMIRDLRCAEAEGMFTATVSYTDGRGIRSHIDAGNAEVFLGRAPSVRRTGTGSNADMRKAFDFWMPQLVVRRRGETPLQSTFAAVHEPYTGTPFVQKVEPIPLDPPVPGAVALRITHTHGTDTIICAPPSNTETAPAVSAGDVTLKGQYALIRRTSDAAGIEAAYLFSGTQLTCGDLSLQAEKAAYSGRILAAERKQNGAAADAFIVDSDLPTNADLGGNWAIVRYSNGWTSGHEIERVEATGGKTRLVLTNDHGLRMQDNTVREIYFPKRTFQGPLTVTVPLTTTLTSQRP